MSRNKRTIFDDIFDNIRVNYNNAMNLIRHIHIDRKLIHNIDNI